MPIKNSEELKQTSNYSLFERSSDNRDTNIGGHKNLTESLKKYKWLKSKPLSVFRSKGKKKLIVKDGQHGLEIAITLGIPVWYVEEDVDYDIAIINCTGKNWSLWDFANKWVSHGLEDYQEAIEFTERHKIPLTRAASLLAGYASFSNVSDVFRRGDYQIKDRDWANLVIDTYTQMVALSPSLKHEQFSQACVAVHRVEGFDPKRLIKGASNCRDKLDTVVHKTRDGFLDLMEYAYNWKKTEKNLFALKFEAVGVMKRRNAIKYQEEEDE